MRRHGSSTIRDPQTTSPTSLPVFTGCASQSGLSTKSPYEVLHGSAPRYLGPLVPVADLPGRRTLRSAGTDRLLMPLVRLLTVGNRDFTVAGPHVWNTLPEDITSQSPSTFCRHLKGLALQKVISGHHRLNFFVICLTLKLLCY